MFITPPLGAIVKILIIDDHDIVREGMQHALQELQDVDSVIGAKNGEEAESLLKQDPSIQLVLLDLFMPDTDGFSLLRKLVDTYPDKPVIVLSASDDVNHMRRSFDFGASGYVSKAEPRAVMLSAITLVLAGGTYVPTNMIDAKTEADNKSSDRPRLTDRQQDVLLALGEGKSNKEIARDLNLSEYTIKIHVTALLKTLEANNRTQAVVNAKKMGLLPGD